MGEDTQERKVPEIDIGAIELDELEEGEFPVDDDREALRVHVAPEVHADIVAHADEDDRHELCGVLVGDLLKDDRGPFLLISAAVRGEHAANRQAQVTFTQDTWAHIYSEMDAKHAGKRIVGWYHTHPGFGVFLSPMDLFIHEGFFDLPWQVAFVIDPKSGYEGFFCWQEGKVNPMGRYWIGDVERLNPDGPVGSASWTTQPSVTQERDPTITQERDPTITQEHDPTAIGSQGLDARVNVLENSLEQVRSRQRRFREQCLRRLKRLNRLLVLLTVSSLLLFGWLLAKQDWREAITRQVISIMTTD